MENTIELYQLIKQGNRRLNRFFEIVDMSKNKKRSIRIDDLSLERETRLELATLSLGSGNCRTTN